MLLMLLFIFLQASCSGKNDNYSYKKQLTIATNIPLGKLSATPKDGTLAPVFSSLVYNPLFFSFSHDNIQTYLAESVEIKNDTDIQIKLKAGKGIDAISVKKRLLEAMASHQGVMSIVSMNFNRIDIISEYELVIKMKRFDRFFIRGLESIFFSMGENANEGTGEFEVITENENELVLKRKKEKVNKINFIKVLRVLNHREALRDFMNGKVDVLFYTNIGDYDIFEGIPSLKFNKVISRYIFVLLENHKRYKKSKREDWAFLNLNFDRLEVLTLFSKSGNMTPAHQPIPKDSEWFDRKTQQMINILKEKVHKDENKDKKRVKKELFIPIGIVQEERVFLFLKRFLRGEGVDIEISKRNDWDSKFIQENAFDLLIIPLVCRNAFEFLYLNFHSASEPSGINFWGYSNPKVDRLLDEARFTKDFEKAKAALNKAALEIIKEPPGMFLYWFEWPIIYRDTCKGFKFDGQFFLSLSEVECQIPAEGSQ